MTHTYEFYYKAWTKTIKARQAKFATAEEPSPSGFGSPSGSPSGFASPSGFGSPSGSPSGLGS